MGRIERVGDQAPTGMLHHQLQFRNQQPGRTARHDRVGARGPIHGAEDLLLDVVSLDDRFLNEICASATASVQIIGHRHLLHHMVEILGRKQAVRVHEVHLSHGSVARTDSCCFVGVKQADRKPSRGIECGPPSPDQPRSHNADLSYGARPSVCTGSGHSAA